MSFFNLDTRYLGIDLGTDSVLVSMKNKGIIVDMPTVIAIDSKSKNLLAVGNKAKEMMGREPEKIKLIKPLKSGVVADFNSAEILLKNIINKINKEYGLSRTKVVLGVPSGITDVEKRAAKETIYSTGIKDVLLIEELLADAIASGVDISNTRGNLVIDSGSGTTQAAVISLGGIVVCNTLRVAGDDINQNIIDYVRKNMMIEISEICAENIKTKIGAATIGVIESMDITGRDLIAGFPKTVEIDSVQVLEAISVSLDKIVSLVRLTLEKTPPEHIIDIRENGIILTGGTANIKRFDELIKESTGISVRTFSKPRESVAIRYSKMF